VEVAELVAITHPAEHHHDRPDDDRILECAVDGQADIIVTGDDHLLRLNQSPNQPPIRRIQIMIRGSF